LADQTGDRLFVADYNNHRIRVIYLNDENRVETLVGTDVAGKTDGPIIKATFNLPMLLTWHSPDQLVVYDAANQLLREVDLKTKSVTTLSNGAIGGAWGLAYWPKDESFYFSDPWSGRLEKMDLKTRTVSVVITNNPQLPKPKALYVDQNQLYVADQDLPTVYQVDPAAPTSNAQAGVTLKEAGKGDHIIKMTVSDGILYALQSAASPLARVNPYKPVSLASPWGFFLDNDNPGYDPFLKFAIHQPVGFVGLPREPRKLLVSYPGPGNHSIVSVKDYEFERFWLPHLAVDTNDILPDFSYPQAKPPKTFRILVVGNSRVACSSTAFPGAKLDTPNFDIYAQFQKSHRILTFPKQLEFLLNAQAALENVNTHFEVLVLGHPAISATFFSNFEVPLVAQKYGIDLVFVLQAPQELEPFNYYYERPLTPEGIPGHDIDGEYMLKPMASRVPPGVPARFYEHCKKKNLVLEAPPNQFDFHIFSDMLNTGDQEIWDDLLELIGRPYQLLVSKLQKLDSAHGSPPKFFICYVPNRDQGNAKEEDHELFWKKICDKYNITFVDLTDPYNALKRSFFPSNDACCHSHYSAYGNGLIALILSHRLIDQKWIPFEASKK
jgi:hypothetical protein